MSQRLSAIPTVFFVLLLCSLGTWQIQRLHWKEALLADIAAAQSTPPIDLNDEPLRNLTMPDYQRVKVTGHFDHAREIHMASRVHNDQVGVYVVTPFIASSNVIYLVNRGWVPLAKEAPGSRPEGQITGEVTLSGVARLPPERTRWQLPNDVARNQWFTWDLGLMYMSASIKGNPLSFFIEADNSPNPGGLPIGGASTLNISNNHLQYAITWFTLAGLIALIFAVNRLKTGVNKL